ncbi:DUF1697 domain-containing protein [Olleya marilimosa]|uniref:DUF1697 domain-containing protein n=1 Tax=Olleya marilimosa TaxID=272164 RepID=UPI0004808770|nr:DUF1697 domain-containing protein [Olleya marilimosa]
METLFVFLRGINVGGHNKIAMQDLRQMLTDLGFKDVKTHIQTGNIVLKTQLNDKIAIATKIEQSILESFGLNIPTLVKTKVDLDLILKDCPFIDAEKENSYFALLFNAPSQSQITALSAYDFPNEKFTISNQCIYLYSSVGYGRTKANSNFFENKLKIKATARNYKTLTKVMSLINN